MKKILVLMLVLGIASMATAALTLSGPTQVAVGGTITITVTADAESVDDFPGDYGYIYVGSDSFSNVTMLSSMSDGDMSVIIIYAYDFYFKGLDDTGQSSPFLSVGDWLTFDVTADSTTQGNTITITLDSNLFADDTHVITVIPEPMTIGLLGLGGLFLRRRK